MLNRPLWSALLAPALVHDVPTTLAAVAQHRDPDGLAVGARALWLLGHHAAAERQLRQALTGVGILPDAAIADEVLALIMTLRPAPDRVEERLRRAQSPGARADVWCDAAALHLRAGRLRLGQKAVEAARRANPDHAEARHFERFIARNHNAARLVPRTEELPRRMSTVTFDIYGLAAQRETGWLSRERLARRLPAYAAASSPPRGSALFRLLDAGVRELSYGTAEDYLDRPENDAWARRELEADQERAIEEEGRISLRLGADAEADPLAQVA